MLRATLRDAFGRDWSARASFVADDGGCVDLSEQPPLGGDYAGVDAMGLLRAMQPDAAGPAGPPTPQRELEPLSTTVTASIDGESAASITVERLAMARGVRRVPVRERGLVGTLFEPPNAPAPGVIVLGGSGGGLSETRAALLASHGLTTLALAYFNVDGLPPDLVEIPLEYFSTAIDWLLDQPAVRGTRLAVLGQSRGGELALLLGATFARIGAVVAYVPSGVVHAAIAREAGARTRASWTFHGRALPFVPRDEAIPEAFAEPVPLTPMYRAAIADEGAVERATIPVERIDGPVLLLSGDDDQMWPSTALAEIAVERLRMSGFRHPLTHVHYPNAGHSLTTPYLPSGPSASFHPVRRRVMAYGGTRQGNAVAGEDAWWRSIDLLRSDWWDRPEP